MSSTKKVKRKDDYKSVLKTYNRIERHARINNLFFMIVSLFLILFILLMTVFNIRKEVDMLIKDFEDRIREIQKTLEMKVNLAFFMRVSLRGRIIEAKPRILEGFDLSKSSIFQRIRDLKPGGIRIFIYPDILTNIQKIYFVRRPNQAYIITTFDIDKFFPKTGIGDIVVLDKNNVCIFSTKDELIGTLMKPERMFFKGWRVNLMEKIEMEGFEDVELYLIYDFSIHSYFLLIISIAVAFMIGMSKVSFRRFHRDFLMLKKEQKDFINMVRRFQELEKLGKDLEESESIQSIEHIGKITGIFENMINNLKRKDYVFEENREHLQLLNGITGYILKLLENVHADAQEIAAFNEELETMYRKLEKTHLRVKDLSMKLERIIDMMSKMNFVEMDEESFLRNVFRLSLRLIPEAKIGTISLLKDGKWHFIDSVGMNMDELYILSPVIKIPVKDVAIMTPKRIEKKIDIKGEEREKFLEVMKNVKQIMVANFKVRNEILGSLILSLPIDSKDEFADESIRIMRATANLVSAFLIFRNYLRIQGKFQKEMILSLIKILEIHDPYTKGHSEFVAEYSAKLAEELGMSKDEIRKTYWAGLLHDIGKVLVSSSILNKPGKLTTEEFDEIRKHPKYGYDILKTSDALKDIAEIVYAHHERIDGSGYPRGLKGDEIPFEAKIIAVVDSFNAMTSDRPYRPALSVNTAMKELIRGAGRLYEARIVRTFIHMIAKMENEAMG